MLCNIMNTSYAGPPKMHLAQAMHHKILCGAELLLYGSNRVLRHRRTAESPGAT
jgi:hypothetical protein